VCGLVAGVPGDEASRIRRRRWTIPKSGILEFDYVSTKRPLPIHQPVTAQAMGQILASMRASNSDVEKLDIIRRRSVADHFGAEQACSLLRQFAGSDCRIEAAIFLHPRVTDLECYLKLLMATLRNGGAPKEYAEGEVPSVEDDADSLEVLRRIGWLNIWNPLDPDVMYR
jgi:hypothetical protein